MEQDDQQDEEKQIEQKDSKYYKEQGNLFFKKNEYDKAIEQYTKAIDIDSSISIYYSNRSRCYKQKGELEKALRDSLDSIELDEKNIKAHLLGGQLLAQLGKLQNDLNKIKLAITRMTKALTLCAGQKKQKFEKDLHTYIKRAKKLLWMMEDEKFYIDKDKNEDLLIKKVLNDQNIDEDVKKEKIELIKYMMNQNIIQAQKKFIPPQFFCQITNKIMTDPVLTQQGNSYEMQELKEFIKQNGQISPKSKRKLDNTDYINNLNLKQYIEDFTEKYPWVYEYQDGQKIDDIEF